MEHSKLTDAMTRLAEIMETLRAPDGCPWDAAQTPSSLKPYLIEEAYEVIEAIDAGSVSAIREELGDLLLQIVFQSAIFAERGDFDLADVAQGIAGKLIRRHPHVFADAPAGDLGHLDRQWEKIKKAEKQEKGGSGSPFSDIPKDLPALQRAYKVIEKAGRLDVGFPEGAELWQQAEGELGLLKEAACGSGSAQLEMRLGETLLALVHLAHHLGLPPEEALRHATRRLEQQLAEGLSPIPEPAPSAPEWGCRRRLFRKKHRKDKVLAPLPTKQVENR